jgi:hypothetical protein
MTAITTTSPDAVLVSLAAARAEAEIVAETATTARHEAEAASAAVRARVAEMDAARREIRDRRAAGDQRPGDGADLELLGVDLEILLELLSRRDADVAAARTEAEKANSALAQARADLAREEAVRTAAALLPRIEELAALLLEAVGQSNAIAARLGRGQTEWRPSADLMAALVPLEQAAWAERHR